MELNTVYIPLNDILRVGIIQDDEMRLSVFLARSPQFMPTQTPNYQQDNACGIILPSVFCGHTGGLHSVRGWTEVMRFVNEAKAV